MNVKQLVQRLKRPVAPLIEQLQAAGVKQALTEDALLMEEDINQLREHELKQWLIEIAPPESTITQLAKRLDVSVESTVGWLPGAAQHKY
jgi:hypothetical protein